MGVARLRCTGCKGYFPRDDVYFQNATSKVCSEECMRTLFERRNKKKPPPARAAKRAAPKNRHIPPEVRAEVCRRDGNRCRWCGVVGQEVHHIEYRSQGGPDVVHNLVLLCTRHHQQAHADKKRNQPLLRAVIWMDYVEGRRLPVPVVERLCIERGLLAPS